MAIVLIIIVTLFGGVSFIYSIEKEALNDLKEIEQKLETVELGMSPKQVKDIVGEPIDIFYDDNYLGLRVESWYFTREPAAASDPLRCMFDLDTGKVIEIQIYNKYKTSELLKDLRKKPEKANH